MAVLVAGAGVGIPAYAQSQRVQEHATLVAERDAALADVAERQRTLDAAIALEVAQRTEAAAVAAGVAQLGQASEPILQAEHAAALASAGAAATEAIGEVPEDAERAQHYEALASATEALAIEDEREREERASGTEPPIAESPTSFLLLDVADAIRIIDAPLAVEARPTARDDDVTDAVLEQLREELADLEWEREQLRGALHTEEASMSGIAAALAPAMEALQAAADATPAQVEVLLEETGKAPQTHAAVTAAAEAVAEAADAAVGNDVTGLFDRLTAYAAAARAAQDAHVAALEAERAAAAAAAAAAASRPAASSGGGSSGPRLCARYRPDWGGGGSLVLVPC